MPKRIDRKKRKLNLRDNWGTFSQLESRVVHPKEGSDQFSISKYTWNYSHRSRERRIDRKLAYLAAYCTFIEAGRGITSKARDNIVSRVQHNQSSSTRFTSRDPSQPLSQREIVDEFLPPQQTLPLLTPSSYVESLVERFYQLSNNSRVDCTRCTKYNTSWNVYDFKFERNIISQIFLIIIKLYSDCNLITISFPLFIKYTPMI